MVNKNIFVFRSAPLDRFYDAIEWIKLDGEMSVSILIQDTIVSEVKKFLFKDVFVTHSGRLAVNDLEEDLKETIKNNKYDLGLIPTTNKDLADCENLLLVSKYFNFKETVLWENVNNFKVLNQQEIEMLLWGMIFSKFKKSCCRVMGKLFLLIKTFFKKTKRRSNLYYAFDPVCGRIIHKGYGFLKTSDFGFVENEPPLDITSLEPTKKLRIILLGGSSVYGDELEDNSQTISSKMCQIVKQIYNRDIEVLNFGVPGGCSHTESATLIYKLIYAKPNIVISFSGYNDFIISWVIKQRLGEGSEIINWTLSDYYHYLILQASYECANNHIPFSEKEVIKTYYPYLDKNIFPVSGKTYRENLWITNLEIMALVCEKFDIDFYGILQPYCLKQKSLKEDKFKKMLRKNNNFYFNRNISEDIFWQEYKIESDRIYRKYIEKLKEIQKTYKISKFLDMSEIFKNEKESCFISDIHYSEYGTSIIADKLVELLHEKILLACPNISNL